MSSKASKKEMEDNCQHIKCVPRKGFPPLLLKPQAVGPMQKRQKSCNDFQQIEYQQSNHYMMQKQPWKQKFSYQQVQKQQCHNPQAQKQQCSNPQAQKQQCPNPQVQKQKFPDQQAQKQKFPDQQAQKKQFYSRQRRPYWLPQKHDPVSPCVVQQDEKQSELADEKELHRYKQCSLPLPGELDELFHSSVNADSQFQLLPGRNLCNCAAARHKLVGSCPVCGRIQCSQEGAGPCLFCSCPPGLEPIPPEAVVTRGLRPLDAPSPRLVFELPTASAPSGSSTASSSSNLARLRRLSLRLQDGHLLRLRDDGLCLRAWEPWASLVLQTPAPEPSWTGQLPSSAWPLHRGCMWIAVPTECEQASRPPPKPASKGDSPPSPEMLLLGCVQLDDVLSLDEHRRQCLAFGHCSPIGPDSQSEAAAASRSNSSHSNSSNRLPADAKLHRGSCVLICSQPRRLSLPNLLVVPSGAAQSAGLCGGLFQLDRKLHLKAQGLLA
ncbi:hypothetical protein BOX15_Mlig026263g1 [Macrostomum lignano]|uniref:Uncharacterized protein n=1 Tax=Macrostomum lignano TaxID=282301 RepID=A0A267FGR5_9PLAT|nr:hypothetical protein BOX15_Mlig019410g1 [Macrostomum lignano]PAA72893.1 hypothetical protein BOX15_Mlig026263g1 [Macrostomum lignano]